MDGKRTLEQIGQVSTRDRIDVLLEEYRALNELLIFRLTAMDGRLPVSAGFVAAAIATVLALPQDSRLAVLITTPPAILWLVRTTAQHARAKEDHLRRIDEIERKINSIVGEDLLVFQSRHPNRGRMTAGRTGTATVVATTFGGLFMLFFCVLVFLREPHLFPTPIYMIYVAGIATDVVFAPISLWRYRYRKRPPEFLSP